MRAAIDHPVPLLACPACRGAGALRCWGVPLSHPLHRVPDAQEQAGTAGAAAIAELPAASLCLPSGRATVPLPLVALASPSPGTPLAQMDCPEGAGLHQAAAQLGGSERRLLAHAVRAGGPAGPDGTVGACSLCRAGPGWALYWVGLCGLCSCGVVDAAVARWAPADGGTPACCALLMPLPLPPRVPQEQCGRICWIPRRRCPSGGGHEERATASQGDLHPRWRHVSASGQQGADGAAPCPIASGRSTSSNRAGCGAAAGSQPQS